MRFKKRPLILPKKRSAAFIHDGNPDNIVYDEEYYRKIAKEVVMKLMLVLKNIFKKNNLKVSN